MVVADGPTEAAIARLRAGPGRDGHRRHPVDAALPPLAACEQPGFRDPTGAGLSTDLVAAHLAPGARWSPPPACAPPSSRHQRATDRHGAAPARASRRTRHERCRSMVARRHSRSRRRARVSDASPARHASAPTASSSSLRPTRLPRSRRQGRGELSSSCARTADDRAEGRRGLEVVVDGWRFEATVESGRPRRAARARAARRGRARCAGDVTLRAQIPGRVVRSLGEPRARWSRPGPAAAGHRGDEDGERDPRAARGHGERSRGSRSARASNARTSCYGPIGAGSVDVRQ